MKEKISVILLLIITSLYSYSQINLDSGLVLRSSFDKCFLGDIGQDKLSVVNPRIISDKFNNCDLDVVTFNGVDQYFEYDNQIGNFGTSDFTISAWVLTKNLNRGGAIISKRNSPSYSNFFSVYISENRFAVEQCQDVYGTYYKIIRGTTQIVDSTYHHCVAMRKGNKLRIYTDGILEVEETLSGIADINNNINLTIGTRYDDVRIHYFKGAMDEILVYNRALNNLEVYELFTRKCEGLQPPSDTTVTNNPVTDTLNTDSLNFPTRVNVLLKRSNFRINGIVTPNYDGINDKIEISNYSSKEKFSLTITDNLGKIVYNNEDYRNSYIPSELTLGIYFYIIRTNSNYYKGKFLISK